MGIFEAPGDIRGPTAIGIVGADTCDRLAVLHLCRSGLVSLDAVDRCRHLRAPAAVGLHCGQHGLGRLAPDTRYVSSPAPADDVS